MVNENTRNRRSSGWRFAWATFVAMSLGVCLVPGAGCAATDEVAETPPQPSGLSTPRAIRQDIVNALQTCMNEGVSRLSRHSYEISFEMRPKTSGIAWSVEPKGSRLDDTVMEECMIQALEAVNERDLVPAEDVPLETSHNFLPSGGNLIGTAAVLPQVIQLAPIVLTASGVTIVVGVGVIVLAAVVTGKMSKECKKQWDKALEYCDELLSTPNPSPDLTGRYTNRYDCARGHVDERCGGNRVDYGREGRPGRRY